MSTTWDRRSDDQRAGWRGSLLGWLLGPLGSFGRAQMWAVATWGIAVVLLLATMQRFAATEVTADTLFPLSVARDTADRGLALRGWALPPGPFLFPDIAALYALLRTGMSAESAYLSYHVLTGGAIAVAVRSMVGRVAVARGLDRAIADVASGLGLMLFLLVSWFEGDLFIVSLMVLGAGFHGTGMIMGLVVAALILRDERPTVLRLVAVGLLIVVTTSSQPLVATQGVGPTLFGLWLGRLPGWRRSCLTLAGAAVLGLVALANVHRLGFTTSGDMLVAEAQRPTDNVMAFLRDLPLIVASYPLESACAIAFLALTTSGVLGRALRRTSRPAGSRGDVKGGGSVDSAIIGAVWAGVVSAVAVSAAVRYSNLDHVRRFLPTLAYPALFLPLVMLAHPMTRRTDAQAHAKRFLRRVAAPMMAIGLVASGTQFAAQGERILLPYQAHQRCLDMWKTTGRIHRGLGDYWAARFFTELSQNGLVVAPVGPDGGLNVWMMNPDLFLAEDATGFDFVIPDRLDEAAVVQRFGQPIERTTCARQPIWRYGPGVLDAALAEHRAEASLLPGVVRGTGSPK